MNAQEREKLKQILRAIKVPRRCDHSTATISFITEYFDEMVITPMEELAEWTEEDERGVVEKAKTIKKETPNGEFRKRFDEIKRVLKEKKSWIIGGSIAAGLLAAGLAYREHRKRKKERGEKKNAEK